MSRTIKFRAWVKNKMWKVESLDFGRNGVDLRDVKGEGIYLENAKDVVLMQFTGLLDNQGKEIWEGDIIQFEDDSDDLDYVVFRNGEFTLNIEDENFLISLTKHYKVIGTLYENPGLLEK